MSVRNCRCSLHNSPEEDRSLQLRKKQNFVTRMFCFELYDSQFDKGGYNIMWWLYTGSGLISILHSPSPSSTIPHKLGDLPRYPRSVSRHLAQWRHRNAPLIRTNRRSLVRFRGWTVRSGAFVCGVCECVRMNCCFCGSYWRILEYNSCYCVTHFKDYISLFTVYV